MKVEFSLKIDSPRVSCICVQLGSEEVSEIIFPEGHVSGEEEEQPSRDEALCSAPHFATAHPGISFWWFASWQ